MMGRTTWLGLLGGALIAIAASTGCVKKGSVTELTSVQVLSAYSTATLKVSVADGIKNSATHKDELTQYLTEHLKSEGVFSNVVVDPAPGDVAVNVEVVGATEPDQLNVAVGGATAEANMIVTLVNTKTNQTVGKVSAMGNSKTNGEMRVGGINTKAFSDQVSVALANASDQLIENLKTHRQ
jgi:hypothetical protein